MGVLKEHDNGHLEGLEQKKNDKVKKYWLGWDGGYVMTVRDELGYKSRLNLFDRKNHSARKRVRIDECMVRRVSNVGRKKANHRTFHKNTAIVQIFVGRKWEIK